MNPNNQLHLKKIVLRSILALGIISSQTIVSGASMSEEQGCFDILKDTVLSQYSTDISMAFKDETSTTKINLSNYQIFRDNRNEDTSNHNRFFDARRNNIGTIIAGSDYIRSQFVSFGNNTNFTFPLKTQAGISSLGEVYPDFRDNIIYTHHLKNTGDLVSCGYLKVTPKGTNTLGDLSQENYFTNTLMDSGFEVIDSNKVLNGKRYLIGKVRVSALDYANHDLFRIDLVTVAYDNQSPIFNEYETFPLQVQAMTNPDILSQGINAVQEEFLRLVHDKTCLGITHTSIGDLPAVCGGSYKSLSKNTPIAENKNIFQEFLAWFAPSTFAQLDDSEIDKKSEIPHGIYLNEAVPLSIRQKVGQIPDANLREYIRMALTPNFEEFIEHKKNKGEVLTPFEQAFMNCGIPYAKRVEILNKWIAELDISQFDVNHITYPDPKIGDCIIPYPDDRHKDLMISGSFESNQMYAKILKEGSGAFPNPTEHQQLMAEKISLEQSYAHQIQELRINGHTGAEAKIKQLEEERDKKVQEYNEKLGVKSQNTQKNNTHIPENRDILLGALLLISGVIILVVLLRRKKQ